VNSFKAGRRCSPTTCTCLDCKNTIEESGANGARSKVSATAPSCSRLRTLSSHSLFIVIDPKAIQAILARNPRAFTTAGTSNAEKKVPPGENACNCIRSRCLKLYCTCFQKGKVCNPEFCSCVGCLNTEGDEGGQRQNAVQVTLEKRPDAFQTKKKQRELGSGCACKNNRYVV
jgi:hypothetical protein